MITVRAALTEGARLLEEGAVASPRLTAEVLLCHALDRPKSFLYSHPEAELSEAAWIQYGCSISQRLQGQPTQYITRTQEFYGRPFRVDPAVLIPRPETEHVIEVALARKPRTHRALDIGCGSGALAVTWKLEAGGDVFATDISVPAVEVAAGNARRLGAAVQFAACDLGSALARGLFDLVLANPPYIPNGECETLQREVRDWEPRIALYGGPTGVEIYERLVEDSARLLAPGGLLVMEIGYQAQERVCALLGEGWTGVEVAPDLAGWPRVVSAVRVPA